MPNPQQALIAAYAPGLAVLSTAVWIVDASKILIYANPASESLFGFSASSATGQSIGRLFPPTRADASVLSRLIDQGIGANAGFTENDLALEIGEHTTHVAVTASPLTDTLVLVEFHALDQQRKIAREENLLAHQRLNQELIRNLAHEIKNPLGGIRGAAQLLETELPDQAYAEYTQVIVKEVDRLRRLLDRMLTPHKLPQPVALNVHEVLEHVRAIIAAEFGEQIRIIRDYDVSLPELVGDREQLVQALLNVARNAAQAMGDTGTLRLTTRIARQVTIAKRRYRHAIEIQVIDTGPGVPPALADQIFYPLVSGRAGGTGLGLSLAQSLINQHKGVIEFDSAPGRTCFIILLPLET